ncbi:hypothetical protein FFLO_03425 [Filobasidium floriforme]|uniref:Rhamnose mutarotase n=1 Tax=Filobasidium floriforme TaxID=5210 RepID=A0A8K0JR10_9TREE|nr:hypothetical protein FFLO_03425 [Filobasidium floriforme]
MRSISSTSAPNILNQLPEPHPNPNHPPHTNEGLRVCQVIGLKPERIEEYEKVHREVWPGVLNALRRANVVDYSIHHMQLPLTTAGTGSATGQTTHLLIAHMRYMGKPEDFEKDMSKVGEDPETQRWWKLTDSMQTSFVDGAVGSASGPGWWSTGREVFRFEG